MDNLTWSRHIIRQLQEQGVQHFCIAPGSRSTPLALALAEEQASYTTHFDERGLGFYALGFAKASNYPVAIIVTSGTAVGNLLPAVMEAWHDHVPLILLTADRPPELRGCGANQTTDQVKIFSSFVHWEVDLSCAFPKGERYLASTIGHAMHRAVQNKGPIHMNCMFREPMVNTSDNFIPTFTPHHYQAPSSLSEPTKKWLAAKLTHHQKGVIICGQNKIFSQSTGILGLAEKLQWPLLADPASNLRGTQFPTVISYYDFILKHAQDLQPTAIIQCGGRLVSKTLLEWCEKASVEFYAHFDDQTSPWDPHRIITDHFQMEPNRLCKELLDNLPQNASSPWLSSWQERANIVENTLKKHFRMAKDCTEPGLSDCLAQYLSPTHALFLANSMPIRDANLFLFPKRGIGPIFTNRGLSGIDGNIATVAGIADGLRKPTIAVIGDLAALHDINSLALIKKAQFPILLIVINNAGGGIFSFLPHLKRTSHFEDLFAHHHPWEFAEAAHMFKIPHVQKSSIDSLAEFLNNFPHQPFTCLLELCTQRTDNHQLHETLETAIKTALEVFIATSENSQQPVFQ